MKPQSQKLLAILMLGIFFAVQGIAMSIGYAGANQDALMQRRIRQSVTIETPTEAPATPTGGGSDGGGDGEGDGDHITTANRDGNNGSKIQVNTLEDAWGCGKFSKESDEYNTCMKNVDSIAKDFAHWYTDEDGGRRSFQKPDGSLYEIKEEDMAEWFKGNVAMNFFEDKNGNILPIDSIDEYTRKQLYSQIAQSADVKINDELSLEWRRYEQTHGLNGTLNSIMAGIEEHPTLAKGFLYTTAGAIAGDKTLSFVERFTGKKAPELLKSGYEWGKSLFPSSTPTPSLTPVPTPTAPSTFTFEQDTRYLNKIAKYIEKSPNLSANDAKKVEGILRTAWNNGELTEQQITSIKNLGGNKSKSFFRELKSMAKYKGAAENGVKIRDTVKTAVDTTKATVNSAKTVKTTVNTAKTVGTVATTTAGVTLALSLVSTAFSSALIGGMEEAYEFCSEIDEAAHTLPSNELGMDANHGGGGGEFSQEGHNHEAISQVYNKKLGIDAEYGNVEDFSSKAMEKALSGDLPD